VNAFISLAANFLVVLFFLGIVGSLVVVVVTFVEDVDLLLDDEETIAASPQGLQDKR
jgi:hypothetical protein